MASRAMTSGTRKGDLPALGRQALLCTALTFLPVFAHAQIAPTGAISPTTASTQPEDLASSEQLLVSRLEGAHFEPYTRAAAAADLIRMNTSSAAAAIRSRLQNHADIGTQKAILSALADYPDPPRELAGMLLDMLNQADASLIGDIATALGRYQDHLFLRDIAALAEHEQTPINKRRAAVLAMGYQRSQNSARILMRLAESNQPDLIRQAAFQALATLWGSNEFGDDLTLWRHWWQDHQRLSASRWDALLVTRFGQIAQTAQRQGRMSADRLVEAHRTLLRVTPPADRSNLLAVMLDDPLEPIRQLAIEQIDQRARSGDPLDATLRQGLLLRLDDTSWIIRLSVAKLLRNLRDESGSRQRTAQVVAGKLATLEELNIDVLRAYLRILTDTPVQSAVDREIDLLRNPQLRADAAAALSSAIDRNMVGPANLAILKDMVTRLVPDDQPPNPRLIELLGRVGDEQDWHRIAQWLDHPDDQIRTAAARTWAQSDRSLDALAPYARVPSLLPIIIDAAYRRGQSMEVITELIRHKPQQEQLAQAWQTALVTMATRIGGANAMAVDSLLAKQGESLALRGAFIGAAVEAMEARITPESPADPMLAIDLYLHHARLMLASGSSESAWRQLVKIDAYQDNLTAAQTSRLSHLRLESLAAGGDLERAIAQAELILSMARALEPDHQTRSMQPVMNIFFSWTDRSIATSQYDQAHRILTLLRSHYLPFMAGDQQQRLTNLETTVSQARIPAVTQPAGELQPSGAATEPVSTYPAAVGTTTP